MYKSKKDGFMFKVIGSILLVLNAVFLVPYMIRFIGDVEVTLLETFSVLGLTLFSNLFIVWIYLGIRYEFRDDYLLVKGGPFKSKIRYEHITKVTATYFSVGDTLAGYRVLASRDGIEINYTTGLMGHVRISPVEKEEFLEELKRHAPNAKISKE